MGLTVTATTGVLGNTIAGKTARTAQQIYNGASVKDIAGEAKDKFVNRAKNCAAAAVIGVGTGTAIGVITKEGMAAKLLSKLPTKLQGKITDIANSNAVKTFAEKASGLLTKAGTYAKAHPAIFAAATALGALALGAGFILQKNQDKTEGKIEQKYDDKLALKNKAAAALEVEA